MGNSKGDRILILSNSAKPDSFKVSANISAFLAKKGLPAVELSIPFSDLPMDPSDLRLVVTLGGDGTVLFAARVFSAAGVPILPINLGSFGFITEVRASEWEDTIELFLAGNSQIGSRLMLEVVVYRGGTRVFSDVCLNEGVVSGAGISKLIGLSATVSGTRIGRYRADGMLIATPTGSTGYSVAAGGPVLHPESSGLILNPICPFTLSARPLVLPDSETVVIDVEQEQRTDVILTLDGQREFRLEPGDRLEFRRASTEAKIVNSLHRNFYDVLRDKLNWGGGANA